MTGIFLDQKKYVRNYVIILQKEKDIPNLFSYTGAFSVVVAQNAKSTTSVDLANRSRSLTEENFV